MERRLHKRRRFWLPVEVESLSGGVAVGHDASDNGLLIVAPEALPIGADVRVRFAVPPTGPVTVEVVASVVRAGPNDEDPDGMWPHKLALRFKEPVPQLEAYLAQLETPSGG